MPSVAYLPGGLAGPTWDSMTQLQQHVSAQTRWRIWLIAILMLAIAVRLAYSIGLQRFHNHVLPEAEFTDGYHVIARNWFEGHGFTFYAGEPPTLQRAPGYPAFLVGIFSLVGVNFMWVQVAQAMLGALCCWLLFLTGRWVHSPALGLLAAGMVALYPNSIVYASRLYAENVYFPLFLALAYYLCRASYEGDIRRGVAAGVLWAAALLTRGTLLAFPLVLPIGLMASPFHRRPAARWLRWSAPAFLAAVLTLAPWALRNHAIGGSLSPVSAWSWAPLYAGTQVSRHMTEWNADLSQVDSDAIGDLRGLTYRRLGWPEGPRRVMTPSEQVASEVVARDVVLNTWRADPVDRVGRAIAGIAFTWFLAFDEATRKVSLFLHATLFILFVVGAVLMATRLPDAFRRAWPALGMVVFVNIFQAVAFPHVRYMSPAIELSMMFGALPLLSLMTRLRAAGGLDRRN